MTVRLVSAIDTKHFGGETVRIGDMNGEGAQELLFVQSHRSTREISCLTATDIYSNVLWQKGTPSLLKGEAFSDLPVQMYDWDDDGSLEVLWIEQADYHEFEAHSYHSSAKAPILHDKQDVRHKREHYVERATIYGEHATMHILDAATGKEKAAFPLPSPADDCFAIANLTGGKRRQELEVWMEKHGFWRYLTNCVAMI